MAQRLCISPEAFYLGPFCTEGFGLLFLILIQVTTGGKGRNLGLCMSAWTPAQRGATPAQGTSAHNFPSAVTRFCLCTQAGMKPGRGDRGPALGET